MPKAYAYPIGQGKNGDPQQLLVYRMENEALGHCGRVSLSRREIEAIVAAVCRNYGVRKASCVWRPMRHAAEWQDTGYIYLSSTKSTSSHLVTITHELAHHIHHALSKGKDEDYEHHGPEFMACHMSILDTCRIVPADAMAVVCKRYGIKFKDPGIKGDLKQLIRCLK